MGWSLTFNENKSSCPELSTPLVNKNHGNWKEKCNVFEQECTQALWVAVCSSPGRKCVVGAELNKHIQNCRNTGKVSAASLTLTLTLCVFQWIEVSEEKCKIKRQPQEIYVTNWKKSSGFTSLYQYSSHSAYLKSLVFFKKRTFIKTSDFSDGPCKIFNRE